MLKNTFLLITSAAALLPTLAMGDVGITYSISNVPTWGLKDIAFPISIANAPHKTGYYFATQISFNGQSDIGYAGLQPRPDSEGKSIIHAEFTTYIGGTTSNDPNCKSRDVGPIVTCIVEFSASYADAFQIEVINTQGSTWNGTVVDTTTGKRVQIGSWNLPTGTGGIEGGPQLCFLEYYVGTEQQDCSTFPYTSVVYGVPTTTISGAIGTLGDAYEYDENDSCEGRAGFETHRTSDQGVEVSIGF